MERSVSAGPFYPNFSVLLSEVSSVEREQLMNNSFQMQCLEDFAVLGQFCAKIITSRL